MAKGKKKVAKAKGHNLCSDPNDSIKDEFDFASLEEDAPYYETLSGPFLIEASFNFIKRVIKDFEKYARNKEGTCVIIKDTIGVHQLATGLLKMQSAFAVSFDEDPCNPRFTALAELARAKRDGNGAELNAKQVQAMKEIFALFPRNITCDRHKKTKEPYLRIMPRSETNGVLRGDDRCILTYYSKKLMLKGKDFDPKTTEEMQKYLEDMVLRLTPNMDHLTESSHNYIYLPRNKEKGGMASLTDDKFVRDFTDYFQQFQKENNMNKDDWRKEAKILENTLIHMRGIFKEFIGSAAQFLPGQCELDGQRDTEDGLNHILECIEGLAKDRDKLYLRNRDLQQDIGLKAKEETDIQSFITDVKDHLPPLRDAYPNGCKGSRVDDKLAVIMEGIKMISKARDEAFVRNQPLLQEIAAKDKQLIATTFDLKHSQDARHIDHQKHKKELGKKDSELVALKQEFKENQREQEQYKQSSQNLMEKLSADLADKTAHSQSQTKELDALSSDYNLAIIELQTSKDAKRQFEEQLSMLETELAATRKERDEALRSGRTNQQVEKDRVDKAIRKATAEKDAQMKQLEARLKKLEGHSKTDKFSLKADEKTIQELSQDKATLKKLVGDLQEKLVNVGTVQESLEKELEEERCARKRLEERLFCHSA